MNEVDQTTDGDKVAQATNLSPTSGSPTEEKQKKCITWTLEQARRDLVDATRRNRLLHAPLTGKRPWCLAVSGHDANDLLQTLYWSESFGG
jgi:hypothetical protein